MSRVCAKSKPQRPGTRLYWNTPPPSFCNVSFCTQVWPSTLNIFNIWLLTEEVCHSLLESNAQVPTSYVLLAWRLPTCPPCLLGLLYSYFSPLGSFLFHKPCVSDLVPVRSPSISSSVKVLITICNCGINFLFSCAPCENVHLWRGEALRDIYRSLLHAIAFNDGPWHVAVAQKLLAQ